MFDLPMLTVDMTHLVWTQWQNELNVKVPSNTMDCVDQNDAWNYTTEQRNEYITTEQRNEYI